MSTLSPKDRVSLCSFTFSDGRHCLTPRLRDNSRFCPYHAQKEARARAAQKLGKDLDYFFSGDYLSACDLSTALGRLIPAVLRGDVKPRAARTVAYLAQTLLQAIHISQHEYTNAFGTDSWRQSIRNSVKYNQDHLFPPDPATKPEPPQSHPAEPQPQPVQTLVNCHSACPDLVGERSAPSTVRMGLRTDERPTSGSSPESYRVESASSSNSSFATHHSPLPPTPLPPTSAEFAQHLLAGRNLPRPVPETGAVQAPQPALSSQPQPAQASPSQPVETSANCHPDAVAQTFRPEGSASSSSPLATHHSPLPHAPQSEIPTLSGPAPAQTPSPIQTQATPAPAADPVAPSKAPQPAPIAQHFRSLALPLPVRRRLHRHPA